MIDDFRQVRHITILGVGLIGASLGLGLKARGFGGKITGLGRRMKTLDIALELHAIDEATTDFDVGIRHADLVVIGTPVDVIPQMVDRILQCATDVRASDANPLFITDVGSVKGQIVKQVEQLLIPSGSPRLYFVGCHPMAGSEKTGAAAAQADLFDGARCIVTPTDNTLPQALRIVTALWQFVGARLYQLSPDEHDLLIAGASHLPHLIASVLTSTVGGIGTRSAKALDFTASGFRDTTRIAAGAPEIWTGIFMQNAHALLPMIDAVIGNLTAFKALLENQDAPEVERVLTHSKILRDALEK